MIITITLKDTKDGVDASINFSDPSPAAKKASNAGRLLEDILETMMLHFDVGNIVGIEANGKREVLQGSDDFDE